MTLCRSVISSTRMAEVKGVRVTPVRNATIPESTSRLVLAADRCSQPEMVAPTLAPALSAGANTPPDAPVVKEHNIPPQRNNGTYQLLYLSAVKSEVVIRFFPDPNARSSTKNAIATTASAQPTTYNTCCRVKRKVAFHANSLSIPFDNPAPASPAGMATSITPKKTDPDNPFISG